VYCEKRRGASQLNFTRVEIRKEYVELEVWLHAFLSLTLVGVVSPKSIDCEEKEY
jgi:hypothetical protein